MCMHCNARLLVEVTSKIFFIVDGNTRHVRKAVRNKIGKVNGLKSKRLLGTAMMVDGTERGLYNRAVACSRYDVRL